MRFSPSDTYFFVTHLKYSQNQDVLSDQNLKIIVWGTILVL